ncbi:MAG: hypothetical protein ACR2NB_03255 [Solirubrobacteraceae bacterium]
MLLVLGTIIRFMVLVPTRKCPQCFGKVEITRRRCQHCDYKFT